MRRREWVVLKFGGTSVASIEGWKVIEGAARGVLAEGHRPMVVCSALAGVSDALQAAMHRAAVGAAVGPIAARLRSMHARLCEGLGVPIPERTAAELAHLQHTFARLTREQAADPATCAEVLSAGERMSSAIGSAFLRSRGLEVGDLDARDLLVGEPDPVARRRYLSATVRPAADLSWLDRAAPVGVTQGFLASDGEGGTVLLGRGGSDTSAARIAAGLGAARVEIWTDVPGLFTADPLRYRDARHLARLEYREAETLASLGAKVLHPRCLRPVREAGIPLVVRSTFDPKAPGTRVDGASPPAGVRGVTSRRGLVLLRLSRPPTWQPVGFLAEVSACFAEHGLSIDLVSTSPGQVAATVDPSAAPGAPLEPLAADLARLGQLDVLRAVASVSVVGTALRASAATLAAAFGAVGDARPHLVVHGATDHHLTFVVDEAKAPDLVGRLHEALCEPRPAPIGEPRTLRVAT